MSAHPNPADLTEAEEARVAALAAAFPVMRNVLDLFPAPRPEVISNALRDALRNLGGDDAPAAVEAGR